MSKEEWESTVWKHERITIEQWIDNLRSGNQCADIRIVTVEETGGINMTIISDMTCGDAYLVETDTGGDTLDECIGTMWLPEEVTKQIAQIYQDANA
jgi:hypothetical protein